MTTFHCDNASWLRTTALWLCSATLGLSVTQDVQAQTIANTTQARAIHQQAASRTTIAASQPLEDTLLEMVRNRHSGPLRLTIPNIEQESPNATPMPVIITPSAAERHLSSLLSKPSSFENASSDSTADATATQKTAGALGLPNLLPKAIQAKHRPVQTAKAKPAKRKSSDKPTWNELYATPDPEAIRVRRPLPWLQQKPTTQTAQKTTQQPKTIRVARADPPPQQPAQPAYIIASPQPAPEPKKVTQPVVQKVSPPEPEKLAAAPPVNALPWLCEVTVSNTTVAHSTPQNTAPQNVTVEPSAYVSQGIIIKRERIQMPLTPEVLASATPEQLASFAPSAGGQAASADEPMIQLPEAPAATPIVVEAQPAAGTQKVVLTKQTGEVVETPAASAEDIQAIESIINTPADVSTPEETNLPTLHPPPQPVAAPEPPQPPKATVQAKPTPKPAPRQYNKPVEGLSADSGKIVRTLAPIADEKRPEPKGFVMDRAKDTSGALGAPMESVRHEAEGVNIEVKTPAININYELEKAYSAMINGQSAVASSIYQHVLSNDPKNEDALFGLATLYHRAQQLDKARALYGRILSLNPKHREAMNNFLVLLADEAPAVALKQLAQLEKSSPQFSPIPAQMAVIYQKQGMMAEATRKMYRAVALSPENLTYRYNLAIMLDRQGNYLEAAKLYHFLIQAYQRGESIPGNINKVQERLTFLRSNSR